MQKGSLVGQSEQQIRAALDTINAIAGHGGALWLATCNRADNQAISPELRRRFSLQRYFFDLPTDSELLDIWPILQAQYGVADQEPPDVSGWTGAEVRACCEISMRTGRNLAEVARRSIVPSAIAEARTIEACREAAAGRWSSASAPGAYQRAAGGSPAAGRRLGV